MILCQVLLQSLDFDETFNFFPSLELKMYHFHYLAFSFFPFWSKFPDLFVPTKAYHTLMILLKAF